MAFDLKAIQAELGRRGMDGWLLYDILHRDPIAYGVLGLERPMVKRRWYYFIPASGAPRKLVHRIEAAQLDSLPGEKEQYAAWSEQTEKLRAILGTAKIIAMQYSPLNNIPYVSMVDAGTVELVRSLGKEVVSSGDLVQQFEARWSAAQRKMHGEAGKAVDEIMQGAFAQIAACVRAGKALTETGLQQWIQEQFASHGLVSDDAPIVAVNEHSGDPHYEPQAENTRPMAAGDWVLLDIWAKLNQTGAVYYDITWVGYIGKEVPERHREIFRIVQAARDAAVRFVAEGVARGASLQGYQVDDAARKVIREGGYGEYFIHRTGHSIGEEVHSTGANMDNLETHDEREIISGTCFSVEPGIYFPEFGVRLEVDVYVDEKNAGPTGAVQSEIVKII